MKQVLFATALTLLASTATFAAEPGTPSTKSPSSTDALTTTMPGDAVTVTNWYKQNVYDLSDHKIGEIVDVLVNKGGRGYNRHSLCRRLSRDGHEGRGGAVQGNSRHDEGQEVVAGHEYDQGRPKDRAGL